MTARVDTGALSTHPGSLHSASERWRTKAPSSTHSTVARPRPADWPSTRGSNSQVPMRRPSGESAMTSAAPVRCCADGVLGEDRVNLADRLGQPLLHAHGQDLVHRFGAGVEALDRHAGAATAGLLDRHAHLAGWEVVVRGAVVVGEAVADDEPMRRLDLEDVPVALRLVALGSGHVVLDAAARREVVPCEGGGVARRAPPALELAWVGPKLPHPLGRCVELGVDGQGQLVGILADCGHGHPVVSFWFSVVSVTRTVMRSIRSRHRSSYRSSRRRATRSASRLVRTTFRRPVRRLVTSPARSRIATCFWTAAKLMA